MTVSHRLRLLIVLAGTTLGGCWVTGQEVRDKLDETQATTGAVDDTSDTGITSEATPPDA